MKQKTLIFISGCIWAAAGALLLYKGIQCIKGCLDLLYTPSPLLKGLYHYASGKENALLLLIIAGLFLGLIKGRIILAKSATRITKSILAQAEPIPLRRLYPLRYYLIIALMIGMGLCARLLPLDIRALIDVTIGSALIQGARTYFRLLPCT